MTPERVSYQVNLAIREAHYGSFSFIFRHRLLTKVHVLTRMIYLLEEADKMLGEIGHWKGRSR